jgi:hypothetical protein
MSLELFEQADRALARRGDRVWAHEPGEGWREVSVPARRLALTAMALEPESFARHFPEAARTPLPAVPAPRSRLFRFLSQH